MYVRDGNDAVRNNATGRRVVFANEAMRERWLDTLYNSKFTSMRKAARNIALVERRCA